MKPLEQDTNETHAGQLTPEQVHAKEPLLARWTQLLGILALGALYTILPEKVTVGPSWLPLALEAAIIVPICIVHVALRPLSPGALRLFSFLLLAVVTLTLANGVGLMIYLIITVPPQQLHGVTLLHSAMSLWAANILVFGLWYWELDGGGPHQRYLNGHEAADFLFPQQVNGNDTRWVPLFVDYLFVAFTCATALSPTDTFPLTRPAKALMMIESLIAITTLAIVAGRAVNIL